MQQGDHVRFDCVGPHHLTGTGTIHRSYPVRFKDGQEREVYVIIGDAPIQDTDEPVFVAGDGEVFPL